MKKPPLTILALIAVGALLVAGNVQADPQRLSEGSMADISGARGIHSEHALAHLAERNTEVNREILRRNNTTEYPVENSHERLTEFANFEAGKASGQTISQLFDEATPGRLPQFFIDEALKITNP